VVSWDLVEEYMHLEAANLEGTSTDGKPEKPDGLSGQMAGTRGMPSPVRTQKEEPYLGAYGSWDSDKELAAIFERTYGSGKQEDRSRRNWKRSSSGKESSGARTVSVGTANKKQNVEEYLLVDGYNIIFAWEELREMSEKNIAGARTLLMDILSNYQGYKKCHLILVFDAYKVEGNPGEVFKYHNIHVVYTKEAETADQYIEKTVHQIGRKYQVTVATSDQLEQVIILGQGGHRLSAQNLREEILLAEQEIRQTCETLPGGGKNLLFHHLDPELAAYMEEVRLGRKEID
jgi:predicted RNA-binding protein with PIN domain